MSKSKKGFVRTVHFQTIALLVAYFLLANLVFAHSLSQPNIYFSILEASSFGILISCLFLYLFSHRDFFHFIKTLEKEEKKQQKKYLGKFIHFGKIITCVLVSALGGSILLALIVRFLFSESENRYFIVIISSVISSVISVAVAKGLLGVFF